MNNKLKLLNFKIQKIISTLKILDGQKIHIKIKRKR